MGKGLASKSTGGQVRPKVVAYEKKQDLIQLWAKGRPQKSTGVQVRPKVAAREKQELI